MVWYMSKIDITEKDVVLIGNGPSAIHNELGCMIDSFHNIVRFNEFCIEKFEKFVGTRTTQWITVDHFPSVKNKENFRDIYYISFPGWDILQKFKTFREYYNNPENENIFKKILLFPETPYWKIRIKNGYYNPSSGLVSILFFSFMYERVFISGFDFFLSNKHHYGDNLVDCCHSGKIEKAIFNNIKENRKNIFYLKEFI